MMIKTTETAAETDSEGRRDQNGKKLNWKQPKTNHTEQVQTKTVESGSWNLSRLLLHGS